MRSQKTASTNSTQLKRSALQRCLDFFRPQSGLSAKRGRLLLESLEKRQMLAGDVDLFATDGVVENQPQSDSVERATLISTEEPEGESIPDLVGFAQALAESGTQLFGAAWSAASTEQRDLFEDGRNELPFIEITGPDRTLNSIGVAEDITVFPTWEFPDGSRSEGVLTLEEISERSGIDIPESQTPTFEPVGAQTVQIGSPLHVPIDVYDPDGGPQTVTISVDDPSLLNVVVLSGNRSIRVDVQGFGDQVFELFEQRAPLPTSRVIELANADFYDGIIFHRVIDNFVIQAGDPTATGSGGSQLGDFDDQFHPDLQHNRAGILSFAKAGDDTNDSQFFVTEGPTRFLDFNHSVFGVLVEGEDVREAISGQETNAAGRPTFDVTIDSIDVFDDTENSVILLEALGGTGSTNVTITVTDSDGNQFSENIAVDVVEDTANSQPYLNPVSIPASFPASQPAEIQLSSTDIEGDPVTYFANAGLTSDAVVDVDSATGLVTVTPAPGFSGPLTISVGVQASQNAGADNDTQLLNLSFEGEEVLATPTSIDLLAGSDTGRSDTDNITAANSHVLRVTGVDDGNLIEIFNVTSGAIVGSGVAAGSTIDITTNNIAVLGDGTFTLAARQRDGDLISELSDVLTLVQDTTQPDPVAGTAATQANAGREFQTDLISSEEGNGLTYELVTGPTGLTLDSETGLISWTPTSDQSGQNVVTFQTEDSAGNTRTETLTLDVQANALGEIRLEIADTNGNVIDTVGVGQNFQLRFFGGDARIPPEGIFAAYADVLFDPTIIRPVPGSAIDFESTFTTVPSGTFETGLIDELGAAGNRIQATGEIESLIATIQFEAIASGTVNIRSEPADTSTLEFLLFGIDNAIAEESVIYGSTTLVVGQELFTAPDQFTVIEDSVSTVLDVLQNDQTQGNGTLSVVSVTQPTSGGSVTVENGSVVFTPAANFEGVTEFTYRASDGTAESDETVTVTVTGINDPPTGVDDQLNVPQNSQNNRLDVLANDNSAPDSGETLIVTNVTSSTNGATVSVSADGLAVDYTPPTDFIGTDSFTYTVSDGLLTSTATVVVTVESADSPPIANDDTFSVTEDAATGLFDVLINDATDTANESFVIESIGTPSQGGSANISTDGLQLEYTPAADFFGTETVTYTIRDTGGGVATGTVTFTVAGVDDPPPSLTTTVNVGRGTNETPVVQLSDLPTNVDGASETLTLGGLGTPTAGGSVSVDAVTGDILYTPPSATFTGQDTFTYTVSDAFGSSNGTITVDVQDFTTRNIEVQFASDAFSFESLDVRLVGNTVTGSPVDQLITRDADTLQFANLLPGTYEINIPAVPFLIGGDQAQTISVVSAPEDGDTLVTANLGRLLPQFISVRDWFGSSPSQSILTAVEPGSTSLFATPSGDTDGITLPTISLNDAADELMIEGIGTDGNDISVSIPTTADARVQSRGQVGDVRLYRVSVEADDIALQLSSGLDAASSVAEGESIAAEAPVSASSLPSFSEPEGELVSTESLLAELSTPVSTSSLPSFSEPEGELVSTESLLAELSTPISASSLPSISEPEGESTLGVSRTDVVVPTTRDFLASSSSLVLPLGSNDLWTAETGPYQENTEKITGNSRDSAIEDFAQELVDFSPSDELEDSQEQATNSEAVDALLSGI